jgi:hypothetical protein
MHAALLSVLALVLGAGALVLTSAGSASADLAGTVTLTPSSGSITDPHAISQVSVSAPCPEHYQDALTLTLNIPDYGEADIAYGLTDGGPFSGSTITAPVPPAGPDGPPWVSTISDTFGLIGAVPADGTYALEVKCLSSDPAYSDTPTFSTLMTIQGDNWSVRQSQAQSTTIALAADPAGHVQVSKGFTLTATVTPSDAAGKVQFFQAGSSQATVDVTNGTASTAINGIARAGGRDYTAVFTPDDPTKYTSSTSSSLSYAVVNEPGVTALDDSGNNLGTDTPTLTAGEKIKLTAEGFLPGSTTAAGESVTVTLDGAAGSLAKGSTDAEGTVANYAFTVPSDATDGSHTLAFKGDTSAIAETFTFKVGADSSGDSSGTSAGDSDGTSAGDSSGTSAGDSAGDSSGTSAGDTSGRSAGATAGDTSGTTAGTGGASGDASSGSLGGTSGSGTSGSGGTSGGSGHLAATGAGGMVSLGLLALMLLCGGGYAVHRVRRDGRLLTFGPAPRD